MTLLTYSQQQAIKKISVNNEIKYNQIATEVEETELRDLCGIALLQDLQTNPSSTNNTKLLNGSEFEDCDGNTIKFKGIRFVLAYMNYSRYITTSYINDTFTGLVQKNRDEASRIDEGTVRRIQTENRKLALAEWSLVERYLNENCDIYTLWKSTESKKPYAPKFTFLRKTQD